VKVTHVFDLAVLADRKILSLMTILKDRLEGMWLEEGEPKLDQDSAEILKGAREWGPPADTEKDIVSSCPSA
jgi:hypothetical protein